jgi:hypothetical protein
MHFVFIAQTMIPVIKRTGKNNYLQGGSSGTDMEESLRNIPAL